MERFRSGELNVIVATSVGEEGLDIGEVDLIIKFDAQTSPIRDMQRVGRTGRNKAGAVISLIAAGREEQVRLIAASLPETPDKFDQPSPT